MNKYLLVVLISILSIAPLSAQESSDFEAELRLLESIEQEQMQAVEQIAENSEFEATGEIEDSVSQTMSATKKSGPSRSPAIIDIYPQKVKERRVRSR